MDEPQTQPSTGDVVIIPCDAEDYVELARTKTGRVFRKHLLNLGNLRHPVTGKAITIDDTFANTLKANFDNGVCDIVQIPLANDKNEHTEDPDRNIGEVIGVEVKDSKLYGILDVRDKERAEKVGKTLLGASAMLHLDYTDTKTGKKVGPTLLHACVTNRPYVTGLEDYEEIVTATSDKAEGAVLLLTEDTEPEPPATEEKAMPEPSASPATQDAPATATLEELLTTLKSDHGIDVGALQAKAAETVAAAALSKTLVDALATAGVVSLSNTDDPDKVSTEDIVGAVAELASNNVTLSNRVQGLEKVGAERDVDALVQAGRIMPAERDARVELKLTNPTMFDRLLPAEPIIKLNNETGITPPDDEAHQKNVDEEIARLSALLGTK